MHLVGFHVEPFLETSFKKKQNEMKKKPERKTKGKPKPKVKSKAKVL